MPETLTDHVGAVRAAAHREVLRIVAEQEDELAAMRRRLESQAAAQQERQRELTAIASELDGARESLERQTRRLQALSGVTTVEARGRAASRASAAVAPFVAESGPMTPAAAAPAPTPTAPTTSALGGPALATPADADADAPAVRVVPVVRTVVSVRSAAGRPAPVETPASAGSSSAGSASAGSASAGLEGLAGPASADRAAAPHVAALDPAGPIEAGRGFRRPEPTAAGDRAGAAVPFPAPREPVLVTADRTADIGGAESVPVDAPGVFEQSRAPRRRAARRWLRRLAA